METDKPQPTTGVIVVGVDHSPVGDHALRWAMAETSMRGSRLKGVHAWDTPMPISGMASLIAPVDPALYECEAKTDVVVGVDGSPGSYAALDWAIDEAAVRHARLAVVHTWWTPYAVPPLGIAIAPIDPDLFVAQSERLLHEMADGALGRTTHEPADVDLIPIEAPAAKGLLARAEGAGLLVVGSRGRGGFKGLLLGSVSQQCLHHAPCTIVVVPEPGRPRPI